MVQLVNALGSKVTRGATCVIPCPVCHKRRQARQAWSYVNSVYPLPVVVCPVCFARYDTFKIIKLCKEQGWVTSYPNYYRYQVNTMFMLGDILSVTSRLKAGGLR